MSIPLFTGSAIKFRSIPHRILLATWTLGMMVIMNSFIANMESSLLVKSETFRIENLDQLESQTTVRPLVFNEVGYSTLFKVCDFTVFSSFLMKRTILNQLVK